MNKFREALQQLKRREPRRSIGFGVAKQEKGPAMLLAAIGASAPELTAAAGAGANVLIVEAKDAAAAAKALDSLDADGAIRGVRLDELDTAGREALEEAGYSFIVSPPATTAAAATLDESCGNVATMPLGESEPTLRAFAALEIDALLVDEELGPLTVARQAELVRTAMLSGRPLLVRVDGNVSEGDLRVLRDSGAAAVLVDASSGADVVGRILAALKELPPRKEGGDRDDRHIAIVPGLAGTHHDHDGDDD